MKRITALMLAALLILTGSVAMAADGSSNVYQGYTYDFFKNIKSTPAPFVLSQVLDYSFFTPKNSKSYTYSLVDIPDVCTSADGRIFVAATILQDPVEDGKENETYTRIYVLNSDGSIYDPQAETGVKMSSPFYNFRVAHSDPAKAAAGTTQATTFDAPTTAATKRFGTCMGLFYHEKNDELYVADTSSQRIVVFDGKTLLAKRAIYRPENLNSDKAFEPQKIAVDNADRIYVVIKGSSEGIIELNEDGSFSRFFGVNEPTVNLLDYFWKSISTDAQKEKMAKTLAPEFNNVALDGEGFIMAVTSDQAASKKVFRLNFEGANVLRELGNVPVQGDLNIDTPSIFVDIAIKPYGTYAVLDSSKGRIFTYNFDGELLSVFGSKGNIAGQFQTPSAIAWLGDKLVVSDSTRKSVYIYSPTPFGQALLNASEAYYNGQWEDATKHFEEVLRLCSNLETAYVGIGKNKLMQEEYEDAMYYFELGNSHEFYSKAYKGHRTNVMKDHFEIIAVVAVVAIGLVVWSELSYHRKQRRLYK